MALAIGPGNRLCGNPLHLLYHSRNGYRTRATWNGNLLPRILNRPPIGRPQGIGPSIIFYKMHEAEKDATATMAALDLMVEKMLPRKLLLIVSRNAKKERLENS